MKFPDRYKIMPNNLYSKGEYSLVPIRYEDRLEIMKWRNEQIFHLRQKELLTEEQQDKYFQEVVAKLYEADYPDQILFSYLEDGKCIGYGGLVHIDWYSKNAEISFIIDPALEAHSFDLHWKNYLSLLYKYAFDGLNLHKVYTYAFDVRPHLYPALEKGGLVFEARLKEHFLFNGEYKDVVIHYKLNPIIFNKENFYLREAVVDDSKTLYYWANEPSVRKNSFNSDSIRWEEHCAWFSNKIKSENTHIYILHHTHTDRPLGQIRVDYFPEEDVWYIGYSVDKLYRGQGLGFEMIELVKQKFESVKLRAEVKFDNIPSIKLFEKSGFKKLWMREEECLVYEWDRK